MANTASLMDGTQIDLDTGQPIQNTSLTPTPISLDVSPQIDSSLLQAPPKSSLDIESLIQENIRNRNTLTQQYAQTLQPTAEEQQYQNQLLDIQNQQRQFNLDAQNKVDSLGVQPILGEIATRQQNEVRRQAQTQLQTFSAQEQATASKLQLAQSKRQDQMNALKLQIESGEADTNDLLKLADLQRQQEQDYLSRIDKLGDNARATIQTLLSNFGGLAFNDLNPQTQAQLQQLAALAGIPVGLLKEGMQTIKDRQLIQQKQAQEEKQQQFELQFAALQQQREFQNELALQRLDLSRAVHASTASAAQTNGLIQAVLGNPNLYETLTPTQRAAILPQLTNLGFNYQGKPLSAEATKVQQNAQSGLRALDKVQELIKKSSSVIALSKLPFAPGARTYKSAVNEVKDVLTRLRTGAALNESEQKFYEKQLPGIFDSPQTIEYKLNQFRNLFTNLAGTKTQFGSSPASDPLGLFK